MDLNRLTIMGNLTKDPVCKTAATGNTLTYFTVATNRVWKDKSDEKQEATEFHNVLCWGKLADICQQYLAKGGRVYVEGRVQTREWDDENKGRQRRTEVVASQVIMLGKPTAKDRKAEEQTIQVEATVAQA